MMIDWELVSETISSWNVDLATTVTAWNYIGKPWKSWYKNPKQSKFKAKVLWQSEDEQSDVACRKKQKVLSRVANSGLARPKTFSSSVEDSRTGKGTTVTIGDLSQWWAHTHTHTSKWTQSIKRAKVKDWKQTTAAAAPGINSIIIIIQLVCRFGQIDFHYRPNGW